MFCETAACKGLRTYHSWACPLRGQPLPAEYLDRPWGGMNHHSFVPCRCDNHRAQRMFPEHLCHFIPRGKGIGETCKSERDAEVHQPPETVRSFFGLQPHVPNYCAPCIGHREPRCHMMLEGRNGLLRTCGYSREEHSRVYGSDMESSTDTPGRTASVTLTDNQQSSVTIKENAKGEPSIEVKVYHTEPSVLPVLALRTYLQTRGLLRKYEKMEPEEAMVDLDNIAAGNASHNEDDGDDGD